jgi:hypothetical protein
MSERRRNEPDWKPLSDSEPSSDTGQPSEGLQSATEQAAHAVTRAVVSTAVVGAQVAAAVARGMTRGAIDAGREAGGAAGEVVANVAEAAAAAATRISGTAVSATKHTADALADTGRPRRETVERDPGRVA